MLSEEELKWEPSSLSFMGTISSWPQNIERQSLRLKVMVLCLREDELGGNPV